MWPRKGPWMPFERGVVLFMRIAVHSLESASW